MSRTTRKTPQALIEAAGWTTDGWRGVGEPGSKREYAKRQAKACADVARLLADGSDPWAAASVKCWRCWVKRTPLQQCIDRTMGCHKTIALLLSGMTGRITKQNRAARKAHLRFAFDCVLSKDVLRIDMIAVFIAAGIRPSAKAASRTWRRVIRKDRGDIAALLYDSDIGPDGKAMCRAKLATNVLRVMEERWAEEERKALEQKVPAAKDTAERRRL